MFDDCLLMNGLLFKLSIVVEVISQIDLVCEPC